MKKIFVLLFFLFCGIMPIFAQEKQLTIDEAVLGRYRQFYPQTLNMLQWRGNTKSYTYVDSWKKIMQGTVGNDKVEVITEVDSLNKLLEKNKIEKLNNIPYFSWISDDVIQFTGKARLLQLNMKTKSSEVNIKSDEAADNVTFSNDNKCIAYTVENNISIVDNAGKIFPVTADANKGIVNGSGYVHREEFGINKGLFWSPMGKKLAFYRKDETMVANYPIVDVSTRIAEVKYSKYPMAGEKSEEVTLGIYSMNTGKTVFVQTGEPKEQFLTSITWDPSGLFIYIGVLNRGQNHLKMNKYDAETGAFISTLFEEKNDKYVEPQLPLTFLSSKPNQFIWQSQRDGFNHLYLYSTDGKLISQLTKGNWLVTKLIGFDKKEENLFIESTEVSPIERHIYVVNIANGKKTKITSSEGVHDANFNSEGTLFFDDYSSMKVPHIVNLCDLKGVVKKNLITAANPMVDYKLGQMTINTIKSADNVTDLYYRLITPPNFDATKKYPAIVYVYGGHHNQMISNTWLGAGNLWDFYMAQKGYVVLVVDNRGSANRGFAFESVIHRQCGVNEMADQLKGIDLLKSLGYVDMSRVGVHGWSYGGFMTVSLMTTYPDVFKAGVAGGPVIDWKFYEVMYGERYMDTPQENPDGYQKTSCLKKAANLKGKLLIVHGAIDPVVVWQNSLTFVEESIKAKVQIDYFVYPRHEHNVRGIDRVHLMKKVTQYFDDNLK